MAEFTKEDRFKEAEKAIKAYQADEASKIAQKNLLRAIFDINGDYDIDKSEVSKAIAEANKIQKDAANEMKEAVANATKKMMATKEYRADIGKVGEEARNLATIAANKTMPKILRNGANPKDPKSIQSYKIELVKYNTKIENAVNDAINKRSEEILKPIIEKAEKEAIEQSKAKLAKANLPVEAFIAATEIIEYELRSIVSSKNNTSLADSLKSQTKAEDLTDEDKKRIRLENAKKSIAKALEKKLKPMRDKGEITFGISLMPLLQTEDKNKATILVLEELNLEVMDVKTAKERAQETPPGNPDLINKGKAKEK